MIEEKHPTLIQQRRDYREKEITECHSIGISQLLAKRHLLKHTGPGVDSLQEGIRLLPCF